MTDQFNDSIPALANQIASDIPDIQETLGFLKDVFQNFCIGWSNTVATGIFPAFLNRTAITDSDSPYTMLSTDIIIEADASGGAIEIDLVTAASIGGRLAFIKATDATNDITIDPNGTEEIDGDNTSLVMDTTGESLVLFSDGSNWWKVGHYDPAVRDLQGDGTAGRVLRVSELKIEDGTNANTIKCTLSSKWNGDAIAVTDNISAGATTGDFTLSAGGSQLTIEASGLSGNAVGVVALYIEWTTLGANYYPLARHIDDAADIVFNVVDYDVGTTNFNLTTLLSGAEYILVHIAYITDA